MALRDPARQQQQQQQQPGQQPAGAPAAADGARFGPFAARQLAPRGITGALQTVVQPNDDAVRAENTIDQQTVGDRRGRQDGARVMQPARGATAESSVGNALHTPLYHNGSGGWQKTATACAETHFRKVRLLSVNPKFRRAQEVCAPGFEGCARGLTL